MAAPASSAKYGLFSSGIASTTMPVRPLRRCRALRLGEYPSSSIACWTLSRVASPTGRYPLTTLDTVASETPARSAMSFRLTPTYEPLSSQPPDPAQVALGYHDDNQERTAHHRLHRRGEVSDLVDDVLDDSEQQYPAQG